MAERVGGIYYNVTLETGAMINAGRNVQQELDRVEKRLEKTGAVADQTSRSLGSLAFKLTAVAGAVAALAAATFLISESDAYTKLNAQLKLATDSASAYAKAQASVRAIANESQSDISSIGVLYARISNATKELGVSQRTVGEITRSVALSMKVSGASATESASAMLQLSQAFASGVLRGEEFNSVSEAAPRLMKALADGLNVPIGKLRSMAAEGKLTSDVLARALPKALGQLEEEAKTVQTISGAFQQLKNEVMLFVGAQMESSGAAKMTAGAISMLAGNVMSLGNAMDTFVTGAKAGALLFAGSLAGQFTASVAKSTTALLENVAASKAASAAELVRLNGLQTSAFEALAAAEADRAAAIAVADRSAANLVAARSEVLLATAEAERTAAAAATAAGTLAATATTQQASAATVRLTAAKVAEAEATAALVAAERGLIVARQGAAAMTTAATASTVALTTAQRAQAAASAVASAATRAAGVAMGLLGGPIGIAIIALGALAWKWNSVKTAAEEAADITEKASNRIKTAQSGAAQAPMRELMSVRDTAAAEIKKLDDEIKRAEEWAKSGEGRWGKNAAQVDTSDLDARREAQRSAFLEAQKAIDQLKQQQLDAAGDQGDNIKDAPKSKEFQVKQQAALAYYQGLVIDNANARAKINAEEQKALIDNQKRMIEDGGNAEIFAKARVEIAKKYARERAALEEKSTREIADLNIAMTMDEAVRVGAIRDEEIRRAEADRRLGVKTSAEAARAKELAEFNATQGFADLAERNARARSEAQIAITKSQEQVILLTRSEAIRQAEEGYRRGKLTFEEAEAAKTKAMQAAIDQQKALEQSRRGTQIETLQLKASTGGSQEQEDLIRAQAAAQLAAVEEARLHDLEASQLFADQKVAIEADMNQRIADMRANANIAALSATADAFGAMTEALRSSSGEQTGIFKVMFAAQKAFAIASSIVAIQQGIANASALPFPANLAAMASVVAATASIISTISGTNYGGGRQYGGPVTGGTMYRVNETGAPEMFTASNGSQFMLPSQGGNVTPANQVGSGGVVQWNIVVNQNAPGAQASATVDEQSRTVAITISVISDQFRSNSGEAWSALRSGSDIQPRM